MGYETAKFGDAGYTSGVSNVTQNVSQHYGPFTGGGEQGVVKTEGGFNEATIDFSGTGPLHDEIWIPAGAVVTQIFDAGATGAVATATVGSTDISAADGTEANYVDIATAGVLTVTGPSAGKVVVRYWHVANGI